MSRITRWLIARPRGSWNQPSRALLALVLLALAAPASAAAALTLEPVGSFNSPTYVTSPPGDASRLFVVERSGVIRVIRDGAPLATPVLDIAPEVSANDERGMLSMAFPDDYATSGLFYVYLTAEPDGQLQIREYQRSAQDPDVADPTGRIVWRRDHPASNHNGGTIAFGPDRMLWLATGDGGQDANNARNPSSQLGKVLRIDPRRGNAGEYTIPADNPNPASTVWASGLRNPFRWSFDRVSGDLVIGDVGGSKKEEIDYAPAPGLGRGANFGWPCREGLEGGPVACTPAQPYIEPVLDLPHPANTALTGGVVVRDPGLPSLVGRYVYADYYDGQVRSLALALPRAGDDRPAGLPTVPDLVAFGEDACGHLYIVSTDGGISRVQDGAVGACVPRFNAQSPTTPPPAPPAGASMFPDRTSPRVRIRVARGGRVGRRATPRISLTPTENCRVVIRGRVARANLKRVRTPLRAGRRTIVRLRPTHTGIKKIHRALRRHRRITMVVSVTAVDPAGNVGRVQRRVSLRRG
jgi:glucose/arabinose dehydrogenase